MLIVKVAKLHILPDNWRDRQDKHGLNMDILGELDLGFTVEKAGIRN